MINSLASQPYILPKRDLNSLRNTMFNSVILTIGYNDRVLFFDYFEHRGISAFNSFSFDFFWKFIFKCSYAFFFFLLLKRNSGRWTSCNRVFLGYPYRSFSLSVKLLCNYSCSLNTLSNLQYFQQNVCGIKAWNICCDIFCKHQSCKQIFYSQPKEVVPIWKAALTSSLWKRKYTLWV